MFRNYLRAAYRNFLKDKLSGIMNLLGYVLVLLSGDFIKMVLIAFLIAAPVAGYILQKWLTHFAYRVSIPWWIFILTAILVMTIAFITVSIQSLKTALTNPVKNLRGE